MEYRQLGASGLRVSALSLGTMTFGASGEYSLVGSATTAESKRQLDLALDAGVNLIDTADHYSNGGSEEVVGQLVAGRRDRLLIATKARFDMGPGPNDAGLSRHHLINACDASLRRLGVDHIDLYQLHQWDGRTPVEETLDALRYLVDSGKVRYVGCSNFTAWQMMKALGVSDRDHLPRFVSTQIHYSLHERTAEHEILATCVDQGVGTLIWSPLAGGLLSGKYRRGVPAPGGARREEFTAWDEPPVHDVERLYDLIELLVEIAAERGCSPAQVALAWLLTRPAVTSLIIGARTEDHLKDNLGVLQIQLTAADIDRLEAATRTPLPYPHWHQASNIRDRMGAADLVALGPHINGD